MLKPGGVLVTGCPNIANLQNRIKMFFGASIHSSLNIWHNATHYIGHIREFTPGEFERILKGAGFEIMKKRMGEEQLDSVIKDRAKLQRDRSAGSNKLNLSKPKDLIFYIIILVGVEAVRHYRTLRDRELSLAQAELRNLRLQLQPHFLFNALNTISATMYDDPAAADAMIAELSELLRLSLKTVHTQEVPLRAEL